MKNKNSKKLLVLGFIIAIILIIATVIGIRMLNKSDNYSTKEMVGDYKMTTLIYEDGEEDNVEQLESLGLIVTLELREDGTGTIDIFGEINELTYNENNITLKGEKSSYVFQNNTISIQQEGGTLILTKNNN